MNGTTDIFSLSLWFFNRFWIETPNTIFFHKPKLFLYLFISVHERNLTTSTYEEWKSLHKSLTGKLVIQKKVSKYFKENVKKAGYLWNCRLPLRVRQWLQIVMADQSIQDQHFSDFNYSKISFWHFWKKHLYRKKSFKQNTDWQT